MSDAGLNEKEKQALQYLWTRAWWTFVALGLIAAALGVFALVNPQATATIPIRLLGAFIALDGVFKIITAVMDRRYRWGIRLVGGLVEIGLGIAVFALSFDITQIAFTFFFYLIGFGFLIAGAITILRAIMGQMGWQEILLGVLKLGFGLVLFTLTGATAVLLVWVTGIFLLGIGVVLLFIGLRMRQMGQQLGPMVHGEVVEGVIIDGDIVETDTNSPDVIQLPDHTE